MQLLPFSCAKLWRNAEHFAACPQTLRRMVRLCCWCWSGAGSWRLRAGCRPRSWAEPFAACTPEVKVFTVLTSAKHMKLLGFFCTGSGLNRASPFFIWREVAVGVKEKVIYELNFHFFVRYSSLRTPWQRNCSEVFVQVPRKNKHKWLFAKDWLSQSTGLIRAGRSHWTGSATRTQLSVLSRAQLLINIYSQSFFSATPMSTLHSWPITWRIKVRAERQRAGLSGSAQLLFVLLDFLFLIFHYFVL